MGMRGKLALACAALLTAGCGMGGSLSAESMSEAIDIGSRVDGAVQLVDAGGGTCLGVRFKRDGEFVSLPLAVPPGYTVAHAVMANPEQPGSDWSGPALSDDQGNMLGFVGSGVVVAGTIVDPSAQEVASSVEACGWESPVLLPDVGSGIHVDPDGFTTVTRICTGVEQGSGTENDPVPVLDLSNCVSVTQEPWD